ncbi:alpha/beta hydrolase fold domain-containing protein [Kineococcus xinjiangensis]|nr:alpha/beta hydrolase [Kineococcus xinjiangensis]
MPSWQSTVVNAYLRLGGKGSLRSAEAMRAHVRRRSRRPAPHSPPRSLRRSVRVSRHAEAGWPVYEVLPRRGAVARHVLYLHGGAYVNQLVRWHWYLLRELSTSVPARCVVPVYPLAPRGTAAEVVPAVAALLERMVAEHGAEQVVLAGDSAGGGMALAVAGHLRDTGRAQPGRIVLIAPWVDVSMSNPELAALEPRDPMLARAGSAEAGRMYAGELGPAHPWVSPLFGRCAGLAPLTVVVGTRDLVHPDTELFVERARAEGVDVDLHVGEGLIHVYPLLPTPEGRAARRQLVATCRR